MTFHPYWDFVNAIENYGVDFDDIMKNEGHDFLDNIIKLYDQLRKKYIIREIL